MTAPTRTLARVAKVLSLEPIENADSIELATVLGFQCVVAKKDNHKAGDLVLYFGLDALLETNDDTLFLGGKRIAIRKMRGVISEGLVAPLSWVSRFDIDPTTLTENQDLTTSMRVRQWVPLEESHSHLEPGTEFTAGLLGSVIPKTDEKRLQEFPSVLLSIAITERPMVITLKMDGCSATYAYNDSTFTMYSRNLDITQLRKHGSFTHYHQYADSVQLSQRLTKYCHQHDPPLSIAIQGELCGPSINRGRTGTRTLNYFVFNVWDIKQRMYWPWGRVAEACRELGLPTVPVVYAQRGLPPQVMQAGEPHNCTLWTQRFVKWADTFSYGSGSSQSLPAEGLVVKTDDDGIDSVRRSFKVIAPRYLLELEKKRK